ncbi:MAG: hypothetical protein RIC57_10745 [Balneola sp.]|jgi:F0F1-type ATP synthase delta subunit|tara:strand:+ start:29272 stop:29982 length:711 start_codon:yes stop_codon:yes gene_type:complete
MEQNNVRKYFLYALGEIALVMIGILLALQVNNWNEERKKMDLAESYLTALEEDLILDIENFEFQIDDLSFQLSQIDSLEEILSDPSFSNSDFNELIKTNLDIIQTFENANLNNNTFLTLQNTGRVDLLDEIIQFRLLDLNSLQKVYRVMITDNLQLKYNLSEDFIAEVPFYFPEFKIDINPNVESDIWNNVNWENARRKYYTFLNTMKAVNEVGIEITEDLMLETKDLLALLNNSN